MCRSLAVVCLMILAVGGASCSADPETAKRRYLDEGNSYMASKKYPEAIISYRNAVEVDERFGEGRLKLAQAYLAAGDSRNARREAVRAADLMPEDVEAQLTAGVILQLASQHPEARARALAVLTKEPNNARALVLLGNALAGLKDLDAAVEQIESAIEEAPEVVLSYANLGALQIARGDREAAEDAFRRAVEAAPQSFQAHGSLANFLWAVGELTEAEAEFKAALALEPASSAVNRTLAAFYTSQNRAGEAEPYLKSFAQQSGTTEAKLLLADHYVRVRKVSEATGILSSLTEEQNGFVQATLRLAALDFIEGRRPAAYKRLDEVLQREPRNESALEARARFQLVERKNQDALTTTRSLVEINPRSARGQYARGLALEATGSIDEAVKAYQAALSAAPTSVPVQAKLAELYLAQRNFRDALQFSQQVVKARPQSAPAHLLYARALLQSGDFPNAERELLALAKAAPSSAEVHTWMGMLYEAKRDVGGARRSFERALELQPESDIALAGLASADLAEKKPAAALARIEAQLAKKPNDTTLVMMSGMAYMAVRDLPKAEAAYRRLLELDANQMDAYSRLGAIYLAQNRLNEAIANFEVMAKRPGAAASAETMIGTILLQQNKVTEARAHFERAVQLNPRAAVAANNLAWDYSNNGGNLEAALQLAQLAKAEIPDNSSITDTLGWVYYQKGLASLAVTTLKEAVAQNASNPNIHYHLGLAYLKNGNKVEARSALQHVLKLNPAFPAADDVRRALASIEG